MTTDQARILALEQDVERLHRTLQELRAEVYALKYQQDATPSIAEYRDSKEV